ncbi:MAG: DNA polymerase IV [Sphingomonas adhaesiva]
MPRKIIHIDMDAFYASVEQRDAPELRGRPVAVGGARARGVVAAASYEARAFGVRSAMPSVTAMRRCPDLVFVKPRFEVYSAISRQIRAIFADYTDLIEPLSLDEAYLDVTEDRHGLGSAQAIAEQIRARIKAETQLTASAGVSYNKFIAKLASDQNKPDGICVIPPAKGAAFVAALPVKRFHGVGPVTTTRMARLGIETGADLRARSIDMLRRHFGSYADYLFAARARRGRAAGPRAPRRQARSAPNARSRATCPIRPRSTTPWRMSRTPHGRGSSATRRRGRTVTLKVRRADFQTITRARSVARGDRGQGAFPRHRSGAARAAPAGRGADPAAGADAVGHDPRRGGCATRAAAVERPS